ncbi:hypothetical protein ACSQ67_010526 [Phaseolus vulgaris]
MSVTRSSFIREPQAMEYAKLIKIIWNHTWTWQSGNGLNIHKELELPAHLRQHIYLLPTTQVAATWSTSRSVMVRAARWLVRRDGSRNTILMRRGGSRERLRSGSSCTVVRGCDAEVPGPFSGTVICAAPRTVDWRRRTVVRGRQLLHGASHEPPHAKTNYANTRANHHAAPTPCCANHYMKKTHRTTRREPTRDYANHNATPATVPCEPPRSLMSTGLR